MYIIRINASPVMPYKGNSRLIKKQIFSKYKFLKINLILFTLNVSHRIGCQLFIRPITCVYILYRRSQPESVLLISPLQIFSPSTSHLSSHFGNSSRPDSAYLTPQVNQTETTCSTICITSQFDKFGLVIFCILTPNTADSMQLH